MTTPPPTESTAPANNYFEDRMKLYGITPDNNFIEVKETCINYIKDENGKQTTGPGHGETILIKKPIFIEHEKGIEIMPYSLSRHHFNNIKDTETGKKTGKKFSIIRLETPIIRNDGAKQKYSIPKGQGTPPFIPPSIVAAYEAKKQIKTLNLTEGYFKAFKADLEGIYCIGLISITCMTDKATGKLHKDILDIINVCRVERLVWLTDADCRQITSEAIDEEKDLYKRVNGFFSSINKFQDLTSSLDDVKKYFAHINEDLESGAKGLDDLLILEPDSSKEIAKEITSFDKVSSGKYQGNYFTKFNVSFGLSAVRAYFFLNDVTQFYLHHVERRPEIKDTRFRYNGTLYKYNEEKGTCEIEVPRDAKFYIRVGDNYYEHVNIPDKNGVISTKLTSRQKSTIKDDCGASILPHIAKYKEFCNVPSHDNYQQVINNCYNIYSPFEFEPEPGECEMTINYIKHLFGENEITLNSGEVVKNWELGLDYITLLYKNPTQMLPILCFVSRERSTGKTTFVKWLKKMFTNNCAVIGNNDFENGFNSHWMSKSIVCVDETKIDKIEVVEKIKSLSTAGKAMMNAKGKDQVELDIFMKFILLSNNEHDFIKVDSDEVRFWVIKVKPFDRSTEIYNIEDLMAKEIPEFLHFISNRKMVTKQEFRHHFDPKYLKTDILQKIQANSAPTLWKLMKARLTNMFEDCELEEIPMTTALIKEELLKGYKYEDGYIRDVLKQQGYKLSEVRRGHFYVKVRAVGNDPHDTNKIETDADTIHFRNQCVKVYGRCYEFQRKDFTDITVSQQLTILDNKSNEITAAEINNEIEF